MLWFLAGLTVAGLACASGLVVWAYEVWRQA